MVTRKQKITIAITLLTAFGFGMATMCGCSSFTEEKATAVYKAIGTTLNIAYTAGGAALVEQKIDQMAADGKITPIKNKQTFTQPRNRLSQPQIDEK